MASGLRENAALQNSVTERRTGVNFINVLRTAFALVDPKSVRTQSSRQYLFTLLGSTSVKAVRRTLMKPTPKAEMRQSFSTCVYCMQLRFQSNYLG